MRGMLGEGQGTVITFEQRFRRKEKCMPWFEVTLSDGSTSIVQAHNKTHLRLALHQVVFCGRRPPPSRSVLASLYRPPNRERKETMEEQLHQQINSILSHLACTAEAESEQGRTATAGEDRAHMNEQAASPQPIIVYLV